MGNEDTSSTEPLQVTFRKLDLPFIISDERLAISTEDEYATASRIAHSYVTQSELVDGPHEDTFKKIGTRVGENFQFLDQGGGCNTLAGQVQKLSIENRDCKLPTFILGLALAESQQQAKVEIIYLKSNIAHPYVRI